MSQPFVLSKEDQEFVSSPSELHDIINKSNSGGDDDIDADFVYYTIYCDEDLDLDSSILMYDKILTYMNNISSDYRWHKDSFNLKLVVEKQGESKKDRYYFHGMVEYGDYIDDEWYIVYMLMMVSVYLPNISIKTHDNDGEFLLIEASECLPTWIGPENCDNRCWLKSGKIHLIPVDGNGGNVILQTALLLMSDDAVAKSFQSSDIQACIEARTTNIYPRNVQSFHHDSLCVIPRFVAYIIQEYPHILSNITHAVCSRNASDNHKRNKAHATSLLYFKQHIQSIDEMIVVPIQFSKGLYAKLHFHSFHSPRKFHQLKSNLMDKLSNMTGESSSHQRDLSKAIDLGNRIVCGLEILYQTSKSSSSSSSSSSSCNFEIDSVAAICRDLETKRLLQLMHLQNNLIVTKNDSTTSVLFKYTSSDKKVKEIVDRCSVLYDRRCLRISSSCDASNDFAGITALLLQYENSDSWLYMTPDQFDSRMKSGGLSQNKDTDNSSTVSPYSNSTSSKTDSAMGQMHALVETVSKFVHGESDYSGVEIVKDAAAPTAVDAAKCSASGCIRQNVQYKQLDLDYNEIIEAIDRYFTSTGSISSSNDATDDLHDYFSSDDDDDAADADADAVMEENEIERGVGNDSRCDGSVGGAVQGMGSFFIQATTISNSHTDFEADADAEGDSSVDSFCDSDDKSDDEDDDDADFLENYYEAMDSEVLSEKVLSESFERIGFNQGTAATSHVVSTTADGNDDDDAIDESAGGVDIETNLLKYLLESHAASPGGRPGPVSLLLSQLSDVDLSKLSE